MTLSRRAAWGLALPVGAVLVAYVAYPSLRALWFGVAGGGVPAFFGGWGSVGVRALVNSVGVSLLTVGGAGAVGVALAWALWRYALPMRGVLAAAAALPLALPPLVGVLAFFLLYGETGVLPRVLREVAGVASPALTGRGAVTFVHVYSFYVYVYLFVGAALRGLDGGLLEASADLGASGWRTFRAVVLPAVRPALVSASLLVFMLSMGSFTAPLLFAGPEPFLTTQIYDAKLNGELALSATAAAVLAAICLLVLVAIEARGGGVLRAARKGTARPAEPLRQGAGRVAWGAFVALTLAVVALPVAAVVGMSFADTAGWTTQLLPQRYTLDHYARLFTDRTAFAPVRNSLWMAALATTANLVFGVAAALVIVKGRIPGRGVLHALAILPFAIPGTVIGLNLLVAFVEPSPLAAGQVLVGSVWILPLAYFVRHVPLVVRAATSALEGLDDRLAEASADLGASGWGTFRRVVLPAIGPSVAVGTLLTWVAALGEFVASVLLYVFGNRPISVEILAQLRLYDLGAAAAYAVVLMLLVGLSTVAFRVFGVR